MSNKTTNNFPVQNNWSSNSVNIEMTPQPVNFHNISAVHHFTNSPTHVPQNNYPISNVKPNQEMRPPFNAIGHSGSFELQHSIEPISRQNPYNQAPNMNHSFNSQSNQSLNNFTPESTFERGFAKQAPQNYPFPKQNSIYDSGTTLQMQFTGPKNNFDTHSCVSNNTQLNLPPPNSQNNQPMRGSVPFEQPPPFQNNFEHRYSTHGPPQQQRNVSYNQNCGPMYDLPPPNQGPMHITNSNNGADKFKQNHQTGQFGFGPPCNQPPLNFSNEKHFQNNPQHPQGFSNLNVMLPPPPFCEPPPYSFLTPPPFGPSATQSTNVLQGCATVPSVVSEEEHKLASFLQRFPLEKKGKSKNGIAVAEFRSYLQKGFLLSKMMKIRREKLVSLLQSSEAEWEAEMKDIAQIKHQLSAVCEVLSVPSNLSAVQRKLKLIKKKREIKLKLKQEASSVKLKKEQEREALSQEIDKWLDTIKEKNLKQKREIEMKKEADNILSEVKRKIQEAKKAIEKLKVFEKLRQVRQANAEQKGLFSDQNAHFEKKVSELRSLLNSQLADYGAEERALKVMLESEQSWQLEQEAEWRIKRGRAIQRRRQGNILRSLFGESEEPSPEDPLFFFFQHHNSGNTSIENLVQIRHHWDVHLSDTGEAIPQQWVVPVPASNPSWEEVCKD